MKLYLPHALWTVNILIYILLIWWGLYWWSSHDNWYAYEYLFITLYSVALFFLAAMLYPWDMDRDIDVRAYFFRNRMWFFGAMFIVSRDAQVTSEKNILSAVRAKQVPWLSFSVDPSGPRVPTDD